MNITDDEKSVAQRVLNKCREQEKKRKLVPVLVAHNTWVMMPTDVTKEQIEAKKLKYNRKDI